MEQKIPRKINWNNWNWNASQCSTSSKKLIFSKLELSSQACKGVNSRKNAQGKAF